MCGIMKDGEWSPSCDWQTDEDGSFRREPSRFHSKVERNPKAAYRAEPARYHLYVSYACPWSHRALIIRALKGLEDAISVSVVHPLMGGDGWVFRDESGDLYRESASDATFLHEVYALADPKFSGRVTVPVLWDTQRKTIVNNESREIMRILDVEFHHLARRNVTLFPEELADSIEEAIDALYAPVNDGVYRCGFAGTQAAYERAFHDLFAALDHYNHVLRRQRYLCGSHLTEADVCMFATLVRFDPVYYVHFKCNERRIIDYPHLSNYLREIYQLPGVAPTCRFDHIKRHYYGSHRDLNPKGFVPFGPDLSWMNDLHGRERLGGGPPAPLAVAA
jgi:putative glutathione S-transferase